MTKPCEPTTGVHALVPIKNLSGVKTRLGDILSAEERRLLVRAMADDVVAALGATKGLASISIVTHDKDVATWAKSLDLALIDDTKAQGLSDAVGLAAHHMKQRGVEAILIVLADIPFVTAKDFEALVTLHTLEAEDNLDHMILSTSRDNDGSNAMLLAPPDAMTFHYGAGSADAHCQAALMEDLEVTMHKLDGIAHDIDTPQDLKDLVDGADRLGPTSKTRQFLTSSGIAARISG